MLRMVFCSDNRSHEYFFYNQITST
jgi:hypothetical protein